MHDLRRYLNIRAVSSPSFSPDGRRIVFLCNLTGVPQVWMMDIEEDNLSMQLLSVDDEERVSFVDYCKTKDLIAYDIDSGGDERFQINVIENRGERVRRITSNPKVIHSYGDFSPDGTRISYSSNNRNQSFFDVYVQDIEGDPNSGELVYQSDETNADSRWSPRGDKILFKTIYAPFNHDLFMLDLSSRNAYRVFEHESEAVFDFATFSKEANSLYCLSDYGREFTAIAQIDLIEHKLNFIRTEESSGIEILRQSPDCSSLAFSVNRDGYSELNILNLDKNEEKNLELPRGSIVSDFSWSGDSKRLALALSSSVLNSDIWICDLKNSSMRRVTQISTSGIRQDSFVQEQLVKYRSFDDLEIASYLFLPEEGEGTFPLLVYIHGGPEAQFRPTFSPLLQYFLKLGIALGVPNVRGSAGYGRRFTHLDDVRNRMNSVKDVESFLSFLKDRPDTARKIDFSKVAAWGGSYGGFMVLGCLYDHPDAWAAGVDIVGIANFVTFLRKTGPWRRKLRIAEYGDPDKDYEFLTAISPVTNASKIKAPLFVIHGNNDPRVPLEEAEQIAETMQNLGREFHLLKFESEGHGLHKISDRIEGYSQAIDFLLAHLEP